MLETLTSDDFEPLLNDEFELSCDETPVSLTLTAVDVMDERYSRPGARLSFSLTLSGPLEPLLQQGVYTLRNETLGALEESGHVGRQQSSPREGCGAVGRRPRGLPQHERQLVDFTEDSFSAANDPSNAT